MKALNGLLGLVAAAIVVWFLYVWTFEPQTKNDIQDWWYSMTIDCEQLQQEVSSHQRCILNDDCELPGKEKIRAEKLEVQYRKYCSAS